MPLMVTESCSRSMRLSMKRSVVEEVVAVELGVEAEHGAAEQAVDDLLPPGTDAEGFGVRPGNVPEGDDGRLGQSLPHHAGQQREVVVLHEHDRVVSVASFTTASANRSFTAA